MLGKSVVLTGVVKDVVPPRSERTPYRIEVVDTHGGSIEVVYWSNLATNYSGASEPVKNMPWGVSGVVSEYGGRLQIRADGTPVPVQK